MIIFPKNLIKHNTDYITNSIKRYIIADVIKIQIYKSEKKAKNQLLKKIVMKVILEHIHTHERLRFSSLKDLNDWILNKKVFWNVQSFRIWSVYRDDGGKTTVFGKGILNLYHYVLHYKLFYGQKEKNHRFCNPCGFPISKL